MKRFVLATVLGFAWCGAAQATAIDLGSHHAAGRVADLAVVARTEVVAPPPSSSMSELPEPEVFAMMVVGLLLIGYRATRHSSEKFK